MQAFKVWTEQRVVMAVVRGGWNERTARDYAEAFQQAAAPLSGADWAHLVYLDDWVLGVPEIEPVIRDLVAWCQQRRLRYVAHVYSPNMVKQYQLERMISTQNGGFEKRVYADEPAAFAWLAARGFSTNSQRFILQSA